MAQKIRIARLDSKIIQSPLHNSTPLWDHYAAINQFIRRYLPASSASIIAEPVLSPTSSFIDWCTDIAGQPQALSALEHDDKARAQRLAADRLQGLRDLAARHADDPAAALLAAATRDPVEDALYVVNGQPVIIGWGRGGGAALVVPPSPAPAPSPAAVSAPPPSGAVPVATVVSSTAAVVPARRGCWLWGMLGLLLGLVMLAALAWWLWPSLHSWWTRTDPDRLAVLEAEETTLNSDIAALEAELRRRLDACVAAAPPLPEKPKTAEPEAPKAIQPPPMDTPAVIEDKPVPPPETPKPPAVKAEPPKAEPPKQPAPKPQPPKQQANAEPTQPPRCPPPRKKWEAPELVLLLDSSGSMRLKAGISQEQITALIRRARQGDRAALAQLQSMISGGGGADSRLSAAKAAVGRLLNTLPGDIDVGLVAFGHCQGADNYKFFPPSERGKLKALVDSIQPMEGTPLARGIERAGAIVDGRSVPATLVVITDGEDSCGGDPCAAARALKAAKPQITINVVDVNGMGEGRCIADATGGRVLAMKSADELPELIRQASGQAAVPPGCSN